MSVFEDPIFISGEKTTQTTFHKLGKSEWNEIETQLDPLTNLVLDALCKLGGNSKGIENYKSNQLKICGDIYDLLIKKELIKIGILTPINQNETKVNHKKKKNKNKNKKMGKEDIIKQNIINNVNKILESTLATFKTNNFNPSFGFNSSYAEIKIITMMYCAYNLMSRSQIQYEKCYELVLGIKKTLYNISQLEGLSPSIISDLETV